MATKTYLDLAGLQSYDVKIKEWSNSANQAGYKSVIKSTDGNNLYFYKKANAVLNTDAPDETIALGGGELEAKLNALVNIIAATYDAEEKEFVIDGLNTTAKNTLVAAINELLNNIGDISNLETVEKTNLVTAINELKGVIEDSIAAAVLSVEEENGEVGSDILKSYKFYQGVLETDDAAAKADKLITTINIPKDYVVRDASIGVVETPDEPYEGATIGEKYIDLVINTNDGTGSGTVRHLYLPFSDLMDAVTGSVGSEVTVAINEHNQISATINTIDGDKITYIAESSEGAGDGETVKEALTRLDGADTVEGSVSKKIKDAISDLGTSTDVNIATYTAGTSGEADVITISGSVTQSDGIISDGASDDITLSTITSAEIDALFS